MGLAERIFGKNKSVGLPVMEEVTDEQLYKDVYSAQDAILKEANEILSSSSIDEDEYNRLMALSDLGFSGAEAVVKMIALKAKISKQTEFKQAIELYSMVYPNNRFINMYCVDKICDKYNLILGPSANYGAEIPDKNQKEIVNFKFRRADYRCDEIVPSRRISISNDRERLIRTGEFYPEYRFQLDHLKESIQQAKDTPWISGTDLLIIAPIHKFNTRNMEVSGRTLKSKLKDPIVLQPVKGGYLIVSSWGLEASDPMVTNANHN